MELGLREIFLSLNFRLELGLRENFLSLNFRLELGLRENFLCLNFKKHELKAHRGGDAIGDMTWTPSMFVSTVH